MKCFIYLCCIAHFLTEISARLRLTTPMLSSLHSNEGVARQASKIAEMIDFVNNVYNDDGQGIARSGGYDPMIRRRRIELPAVKAINLLASAVVPNYDDMEDQLENPADTVRYQVIDNPEVLEEYSNKQKQRNNEKLLNPAPVAPVVPLVSDTSAEAKSFSTVEKKLRYYRSTSNSTASQKSTESIKLNQLHHTPHPNPLDGVQELTTVKPTYRPSFPEDDDDDDDKPIKDNIEVTVTEKEINTPRADEKKYGGLQKINDTIEIEKRKMDNKVSDKKDQARIEEEKVQMDATKETGQIKHELTLKKDNNKDDDGMTVNEEKSGSNKEYISTKLDHISNERPSEDNVRPRDEDYKNDDSKKIDGTTDNNSAKDKLKKRSWDANKIIHVPLARLMGRIDKLALRNKQKNKHDLSIYSDKEINENSNKQFKNRHEKRDEYDRKKKDKNDDRLSKKENEWNNINKQLYSKDNRYDRMEYEWNKRHLQYDENDNWNTNDNQWDKNDDFNSRDRDSNKRDNDWDQRDNDWDKRDSNWDKRDNNWKKRDFDSNKRDNDWNNRDIDSNTRDSDWNKRDNGRIKQDIEPHKDDRNKNVSDRKQNEREKKYSDLSVENDGGIADGRYEIVEMKRKDGDYNRHSEV